MLKEIKVYTIVCDNCGANLCDESEYCGWNETDYIKEIAENEGWKEIDGNNYCPDCWRWNEDADGFITNNKKTIK